MVSCRLSESFFYEKSNEKTWTLLRVPCAHYSNTLVKQHAVNTASDGRMVWHIEGTAPCAFL